MKKLILISTLLLVGCSQEQDTRLVCECFKEREVIDQEPGAELTLGDALGPNSSQTPCSNTNRQTLVFNQSKEKLLVNGDYLVAPDIGEMFNDETIRGENTEPKWFGIQKQVKLNRVLLVMEIQSYIPELSRVSFGELSGSAYTIEYSQCKVVDGV